METKFDIVSYVGAKPLLFGMTEVEVRNLVGKPAANSLTFLGEEDAQYDSFSVRYSPKTRTLVEIGFSESADVTLNGLKLFRNPESFRQILLQDSCPYEHYGFLILFDLGITLTGFHDDDISQRAITVFERGRWDHLKPEFKRFQATESRSHD